ncbi:sulfatase-like hydrolase/transferase [Allorhizobium undicola]|uniref:sulfatase-like hydrolase/transferase n=1 Tax=Allorhizobium undicola TaxID=78527 RepID=UPI000684D08A|nr:sulfatase-like hydrolase/transferase [Allorhizobium undicola]
MGLSCLASIALCGALLVADAVDEIGFYFTGVFLVIFLGGYCLMLAAPRSGFGWHRLAWPFIGLVPLFGWFALHELFGHVQLQPILFHIRYEYAPEGLLSSLIPRLAPLGAGFAIIAAGWVVLASLFRGIRQAGPLLCCALLLANPLWWQVVQQALLKAGPAGPDLEAFYVDPLQAVAAFRPDRSQEGKGEAFQVSLKEEKPLNLIHVFLESAELTFWNEEVFGDVATPLKRLSEGAFVATGIEQLELTSWTLAGQVASTCGVPLFPLGAVNHNHYDVLDRIMPDAVCLGDILARDGYRNVFMKGASLDFAGTRGFAAAHGYETRMGFDEMAGRFTPPFNEWGLNDDDLFVAARQEIERLRNSPQPYSLTLTTIGGHSPNGFVAPSCRAMPAVARQPNHTLAAFACTNLLLEAFITDLRARGLLENTVVVIQSDHLAMRNDVYAALNRLPRRNLFMVIGGHAPAGEISRSATPMGIFPTILEAMGYHLPSRAAGLGCSLLSERPSLLAQLGRIELERGIDDSNDLRDRLWGLNNPEKRNLPQQDMRSTATIPAPR